MQYANVGQEYWAVLNKAKFDVESALELGLKGIFIRDYKNYNLEAGIMGVGVSTGSFDTLCNHFGKDKFAATCQELVVERNLGLFVVISIQVDAEGNNRKDITVYKPASGGNDLTAKYESLQNLMEGWEQMQLADKRTFKAEELNGLGEIVTYVLGNPSYTRKKFEAVVKGNPW